MTQTRHARVSSRTASTHAQLQVFDDFLGGRILGGEGCDRAEEKMRPEHTCRSGAWI